MSRNLAGNRIDERQRDVFDATQFSRIRQGTMKGKMPYSVSLTE
jgi:hypothetical protein